MVYDFVEAEDVILCKIEIAVNWKLGFSNWNFFLIWILYLNYIQKTLYEIFIIFTSLYFFIPEIYLIIFK